MFVKFFIFAVAAFVVWKLFVGDHREKKIKGKAQEKNVTTSGGDMTKDPICGTYVGKDGDIRVRQGETIYFFCSYECRDEFIKSLSADSLKE